MAQSHGGTRAHQLVRPARHAPGVPIFGELNRGGKINGADLAQWVAGEIDMPPYGSAEEDEQEPPPPAQPRRGRRTSKE